MINSHYGIGGAGKIVSDLHSRLQAIGHESHVICGRGDAVRKPGVTQISTDRSLSVRLSVLIARAIGLEGYSSWLSTKKAIKAIQDFKPDIIHLHGLHGYYLNYSMLFNYINRNGIKCVWTFHDCLAFTGKCGYPYECMKYKSGCGGCPLLRDYPKTYGVDLTRRIWQKKKRLFTKNGNMIIATPSEWLAGIVENSFFSNMKSVVINNGIDTNNVFYMRNRKECRAKKNIPVDAKVVLAIAYGLDNPRKGVKYVIQLAKDLSDQGVLVILIGWKQENDPMIEGLNNIITIPFIKNQDELAEFYSAADVFVIPSLAENYATTTIESLACGTPVVGFDVGGIPEQLRDGNGVIVQPEDQAAFNVAVLKVLNKEAGVLTSEGLEAHAKERNSREAMTKSYLGIYESLYTA